MKKLLVIDDMQEWINGINRRISIQEAKKNNVQKYFLCSTQVSNSVAEAMDLIRLHEPEIILLDHSLSEDGGEGKRIAQSLIDTIDKDTLILSTSNYSEKELEKIYRHTPVSHFPRKNIDKIFQCLEGKCNCGENGPEKKEVISEGLNKEDKIVLLTSDPELTLFLEEKLKTVFPNLTSASTTREALGKIYEEKSVALILEKVEDKNPLSILPHDSHYVKKPQDQDFDKINWKSLIIISFDGAEEKFAEENGYEFIKVPCEITEFEKLLAKKYEIWEIKEFYREFYEFSLELLTQLYPPADWQKTREYGDKNLHHFKKALLDLGLMKDFKESKNHWEELKKLIEKYVSPAAINIFEDKKYIETLEKFRELLLGMVHQLEDKFDLS